MRGLVVVVMALGLAACATGRISSGDAAAPTTATRTVTRAPSGPEAAHDLARRLGLSYCDADSHVLLSNGATRVRIWKDSNDVSVGGESARMGERTRRRGRTLLVPPGTVSYVEGRVAQQRTALRPPPAHNRRAAPTVAAIALPAPRPEPVRIAPKPEPVAAPEPASVLPAAEAGWDVRGVTPRAWRWIVLHHSDDTSGNLAKYDRIHRETNGWDECGYHFVIGNGSMSGNGQVEIGSRWFKQKHGAHCKTADNCFNDFGVGICLVGDFENGGRPSAAQMEALVRLCRWLMARYDIPLQGVVGHSDCKATACPGKYFPWAEFRARLAAP